MVQTFLRRKSSCGEKASVFGPVLERSTKGSPDLAEELGVSS